MDFAKVSVEARSKSGKGAARKARAVGRVPAILYGHKEAPVSLSLDPRALLRSLDKERKRNTVFSLALDDNGKTQEITAMIRDFQIHPLKLNLIHVDFIRVSMDEEVKVTVPLALTGIPVGVVNGGNLHASMHTIPLAARPDKIPSKIEIDVTGLEIGEALHVSDLKLPDGTRCVLDGKYAVASVVAPRAEKVETVVAATPAEGAAAAPAEGAAAGAAAGEKGAAPAAGAAKKEGGEKKGK